MSTEPIIEKDGMSGLTAGGRFGIQANVRRAQRCEASVGGRHACIFPQVPIQFLIYF